MPSTPEHIQQEFQTETINARDAALFRSLHEAFIAQFTGENTDENTRETLNAWFEYYHDLIQQGLITTRAVIDIIIHYAKNGETPTIAPPITQMPSEL